MATIVIDPGHTGGYNQGVCYGYYEGNAMLTLAKYLGERLTAMGANVIYTRTTNAENPSLAERGAMAANADLFISLHSDASDNANARGVTSFYSVRLPNTEPFATDIGTAVANVMGNQFRGSVSMYSSTSPTEDYFGVLRAAVAAGAKNAFLIEHGFHTNEMDCMLLSDDAVLRRIADAEAAVIAEHLGLVTGCLLRYTVQPGDTLFAIARKFNITWESIAAANNIAPPYVISPGQQLAIPISGKTATSCRLVYTVRAGDSLYSIARNYGVSWETIAAENNMTSPYVIAVGERIVVPLSSGTETGCQFIYTVQSGDSLYSIAQKYGVTWEAIASANEIYHPFTIVPGRCLIIPLPRI